MSFKDEEATKALRRISNAVDTWAEYIRVDPVDLVLDEPYNTIIFQPQVLHNLVSIILIHRFQILLPLTTIRPKI